MTSHRRASEQDGFTLIELLVVVVIIAILAAIAVPVFFKQREKGYVAQMQSALKNAALAAESYATGNGGSYVGLDASDPGADARLADNGFIKPEWARPPATVGYLEFRDVTATYFCIQARHEQLTASSAWRRSTYESDVGAPRPVPDGC